MYEYDADVVRVVDGDTLRLRIDLGFRTSVEHPIRVDGVDAPERSTPEGKLAKQFVTDYLVGKSVVVQTNKEVVQSFERYVARVWVDGKDLAETLRENGFVKAAQPLDH